MKTLNVDSSMRALIGGAFYPSGHTMVMYATEQQARGSAEKLFANGFTGDDVYFVPPADVLAQIGPTVQHTDEPLPSAGTDGATAREFIERAGQGQYGLLVATPGDAAAARLKTVLDEAGYEIARRYYSLAIEDL